MRPIKQLRLGPFRHTLTVVRLALRLERDHEGAIYEPERRLRRMRGLSGVGVAGHAPDGLLRLPGAENPVAIEVELSVKPMRRLKAILDQYRYSFDHEAVWYFVADENLANRVTAAAGDDPLFKVEVLP